MKTLVQTNTDSDWEMRAQIKGWLSLRKEAKLPVNLSVYLEILASLRNLSLGLQVKKQDTVQQVYYIQKFAGTMAKLQIVIETMLDDDDDDGEHITNYKRSRDSLILKTIEEGSDETFYQGIKLKNYNHFQEVSHIKSILI